MVNKESINKEELMSDLYGSEIRHPQFSRDTAYSTPTIHTDTRHNTGYPAIFDFEIGHYNPEKGISVGNYFPDGTSLSDRTRKYVAAHEKGHEQELDDIDCAMFSEREVDPELWMYVMAFRAAFAKAGENSADAKIWNGVVERYSGTKFQPLIDAVDKLGEDILQSGSYHLFREYENGFNNRQN